MLKITYGTHFDEKIVTILNQKYLTEYNLNSEINSEILYTGTVINRTATVPQGRATVVNKAKREQYFVNKPDS